MARGMTADQIAAKWAANLSGATTTITTGINAVTTPPGQAAARQKTQYLSGVQASANLWATNVAAVPLSTWQQATINKGVPRIATGAQAAQPKMTAVMAKLLPAINSAVASLPARGNLQQNQARATAFSSAMAAQKGNFKS